MGNLNRVGLTATIGAAAVIVAVAMALVLGNVLSSQHWSAAVSVVGLVGVLVVILINPLSGLLLWIILDPYARFWHLNIHMPAGIPDLSLSRLSVAFLCVVWLAQLATGKRRLRRPGVTELSMVLFGIMVMPSVAAAFGGLNRTLQMLFDKFIAPFLVFILAKNLYEEGSALDKVTAALAVIEGYLCLLLFYELATGQIPFYIEGRTTVYTRHLRKVVGLLGNAAYTATILAMIAPIALHRLIRARSSGARFFYAAMFGLAIIGNFFCYNRAGWLAMFVGIVVMLLFEPRYRRVLLPLVLVGVLGVAVFWSQISASYIVTERLAQVSSIRTRMDMLEVSKKIIHDNTWFGVGFGNWAYYYIRYGGHWGLTAWGDPTPHNTYILIWTTMGLVTLAPYVLIFASLLSQMAIMLRRRWREHGADHTLMVSGWASILAYMVSAAAADLYFNALSSLVLFLITGTIAGYMSNLRSSVSRRHARVTAQGNQGHASRARSSPLALPNTGVEGT